MADADKHKKKDEKPAAASAANPGKKKPPMKVIAVVAALMVAEAGGVYFFLGMTGSKAQSAEAEIKGAEAAAEQETVEIDLVDVQPALDLVPVRREVRLRHLRQAEAGPPDRERRLGRPERRRPVHERAAADAAPLKDRDREVVRRAVAVLLVELRVRDVLPQLEVLARLRAPLLEDHDARARRRELPRGHGAAGAGADDADVRLERQVAADLRAAHEARDRAIGLRIRRSGHWNASSGSPRSGGPG